MQKVLQAWLPAACRWQCPHSPRVPPVTLRAHQEHSSGRGADGLNCIQGGWSEWIQAQPKCRMRGRISLSSSWKHRLPLCRKAHCSCLSGLCLGSDTLQSLAAWVASAIHGFVTSGLDYNNSMCFETQCGNCTPAPAGWEWGTTAYFMAYAKGISGLSSSLSRGSQPVSDASLRLPVLFFKAISVSNSNHIKVWILIHEPLWHLWAFERS